MSTDAPDPGGIPGWDPSASQGDSPRQRGRKPPYVRAMVLAVVAWIAALAVIYMVVHQALGLETLVGWVGLVGFVFGIWLGGARAGIHGRHEWSLYVFGLLTLTFLCFGAGMFLWTMLEYG